MGFPMKRDLKIRLIFMYYEILCKLMRAEQQLMSVIPGLRAGFVEGRANELISWLK